MSDTCIVVGCFYEATERKEVKYRTMTMKVPLCDTHVDTYLHHADDQPPFLQTPAGMSQEAYRETLAFLREIAKLPDPTKHPIQEDLVAYQHRTRKDRTMPQFSYEDRQVLAAEVTLWNVVDMLRDLDCGAWQEKVRKLRNQASELAADIREYNDKWEDA